jgi:hypothetical protein
MNTIKPSQNQQNLVRLGSEYEKFGYILKNPKATLGDLIVVADRLNVDLDVVLTPRGDWHQEPDLRCDECGTQGLIGTMALEMHQCPK